MEQEERCSVERFGTVNDNAGRTSVNKTITAACRCLISEETSQEKVSKWMKESGDGFVDDFNEKEHRVVSIISLLSTLIKK